MMLKHKNKMASACILSIVVRAFHAVKLFFTEMEKTWIFKKKKKKIFVVSHKAV